jgi:hypothetical protein
VGRIVADTLRDYRTHCYQAGLSSDLAFLEGLKFDGAHGENVLGLLDTFKNTSFVTVPLKAAWVQIEGELAFDGSLTLIPNGWMSPKCCFRMKTDFAYVQDDTLYIIDDKTGRGNPDPLQLELYAHLVNLAFESASKGQARRPQRIVCIFNELGKRKVDSWEYLPGETDGAREKILARLEEVNSWKEYPARTCDQCRWCSIPECPAKLEAREVMLASKDAPVLYIPKEVKTKLDAEMAMKFVLFAEQITDQVKDLVRDFVERNGAIFECGKVAEFRESTSWSPNSVEQLLKTLVAYGVAPSLIWDNVNINKTALEKIALKAGCKERLPMLFAMGKEKTSRRFGFFNDSV